MRERVSERLQRLRDHRRNRNLLLAAGWVIFLLGAFKGEWMLQLLGFVTVNLYALLLMSHDKQAAQRKAVRIPESSLLWIGGLGGAVGIGIGMLLFHHKTRHVKFLLWVPIFIVIQAVILWYCKW